MFEDETIDIACPKCGFMNSLLVREFEQATEVHFVCPDCGVGVKIEASEFQQHLNQISKELENMTVEARQARRQSSNRRRKGDFQI